MSSDGLSERLQALEDDQAILRTLYQYGQWTTAPTSTFVDCFTTEGVWDVRMHVTTRA